MELPNGIDYGELGKAILGQLQTTRKDAGSTPSAYYGHGPSGLFSQPGIDQNIVASFGLPNLGLEAFLPKYVGVYASPVFEILTGITAATGTQPTTPCADCIQPGQLKVCNQVIPFGQECMDSQVLEITRAGELINRSEMLDYTLASDPFGSNMARALPVNPRDALRSESKKKILEMMTEWPRSYGRRLYTGNPANTAGNTGGNLEYNGLDILINTGYRDAFTGVACPSADSLVRASGNLNVLTNGSTAVSYITEILRYLRKTADDTGNGQIKHVLAMRYGLFIALTEVWPCNYLSYRCAEQVTDANTDINVDGQAAAALREQMRQGRYLLVDGYQVPVITDDAIAETQPIGETYQSDIYFVPVGQIGDRAATYLEYFDLGNANLSEVMSDFAPGQYKVTPDGRWIINYKPAYNWCVQIGIRTLKRIVLRTPFLAARLTGLRYSFTLNLHERTWFGDLTGSDSSFYTDGGQYTWVPGRQQSYFTVRA